MDKEVVYVARLHWVIFTGPVLLLLLAVGLGSLWSGKEMQMLVSFLLIIATIWGIMTWVNYECSYLTIKQKQLILRTGLLVRFTTDIPMSRIESLDIRQTVLGSLFQYGSVLIIGTGGSRQLMHYVAKPLTCRRYIEQLMHG
jgi:uncharacterized membrane protein YdbT with pleckstrin-like domain